MGFRQNYFHISPNFGDFGAKMSFFRYIINQKRKIFINHCSPPCSKTPLISEMCIYITNNLCKWGLGTRGGTMFYRLKMGEDQLTAHEIPLEPMENYTNIKLYDKNMKFCILVVHDLTNDIRYDAKLNRSKNCYFGVK